MNAVWAHSLGHGRTQFVHILNRLGLSNSYSELQRYQYDLATFASRLTDDRVQIPVRSIYIRCYRQKVSEHDTVTVLFQDKSDNHTLKPTLNEAGIRHGERVFKEILLCQELCEFYKPIYHPDIPSNINFEPDSFVYNDYSTVLLKDLAWNLARLNLSGALDDYITKLPYPDVQIMPSWKASNAIWTEADLPIKKIAFLPPLPYPCTDYATVYSAMKNFVSINSQLKQDKIPLYCDEKVYCIVKEIQFVCPDEFSCIIPCLGTFHTVKALMKCIGKSLMGTGAESVLLEAGGYGPSIVDGSIMTAGHYNRALEGLSVLGESMLRLVYKEFFVSEGNENYRTQLETLVEIKKLVNEQDKESTLFFLQQFYSKSETFCDNIKTFIMNRASTHENFQIVYDMIRADREGNWLLHLDAIQRSLHEFGAWDGVNYFRWASVYLEEMQLLPKLSPIVYENFLKGKSFSIKTTGGRFNAVGGYQKLEQTINLASKCSDTFISNSKNKSFLGKWNLIS